MRNTAYKLTAFTAIVSAAGFMLRWLQNIQVFDEETGLPQPGMPISYVLAAFIVLAAIAFGVIAIRTGRYDAPTEPGEALGGQSFIYTIVCVGVVMLLAISGALQILGANAAPGQVLLRRILGIATVVAAIALALLLTGMRDPERAGVRRWCSGILILFSALWLSVMYKTAASEPVLWRYAVEILALCASMMALYHVAGYFFGQPNPRGSVFFCDLGAFLCIMSAIDEHSAAENLCFAAMALLLLLFSYSILANLRHTPLTFTPEKTMTFEPEPEEKA